jgi:hypothetical protein
MHTASVPLLANASATSVDKEWPGGRGFFSVTATFGGGSVALQYLGANGATWLTAIDVAGAAASRTTDGGLLFELPPGRIRALVITATGVYATAARIPS